ncbi:MAG: discoidin domain-containing protein, partial [Armatimonadota bacterium]
MQRLFPVFLCFLALLIVGCAVPADVAQSAVDYAHVDSGTTVAFTSEGCNPSPYDVRGAIGDGEHLSYPQAPPNSFILDLGQARQIRSIELDRRYANKGVKHFRLSFGVSQDALDEVIDVEDFGDSKYWYRILDEPITARFVKFESLELEDIQWTVLNRISLYGTTRIPRLAQQWGNRYRWLGPRMQRIAQDAAPLNITDQIQVADSAYTCANFADLLASDEPISEKQWRQMADRWDVLLQSTQEAEAAVSFAKARQRSGEAGYLIEAISEMEKVFRDICPKGKNTLELSCAKNEWESGQVAVAAVEGDLEDVEVTWDRLRGPATLGKGSLDCQLVCYVKTEQAPYLTHHIGWWPDGLSPVGPFDLPA